MGVHGPKQTEDSDIERTPEYAAFMQDLIEYHQQRGTHLQREPALGPRRISLLKLYNKIISYGGYDQVSDTSLMWRRLAEEYKVPPMSNAGMPGYLLKSMYYKNLAAYEIEKYWGRKAPPPELLEHLTARGGAILSRPEIANPSAVKPAAQSPAAATPVRNARPPPITKQPQHVSVQLVVPPMPPVTLSTEYIRPVPESEFVRPLYPITAGHFGSTSLHDASSNNLQPLIARTFIDQHKPEEETDSRITIKALYRAAMALKSGIEAEMKWAVSLLIRASYELADDFILEKVSNLPEILLQVLDQGVSDMSAEIAQQASLIDGTTLQKDDERANKRVKLYHRHFRHSKTSAHARALEVALVLRNATLQQENARYIAQLPIATNILRKALLLPDEAYYLEMKQYCMDICDAIVPGLQISSEEDSLYLAFLELLKSEERDSLLLGLRALSRLSVADEHNRLLQDISASVISRLVRLLQVEDVELLHALAGFFFQYTTYLANTSSLSRISAELPTLLKRLVGLTMWNAQMRVEQLQITDPKTITKDTPAPPANPPKLSDEIVRDLLTFQEPERAIHWMRACFEEDTNQSVTQILLWHSYKTLFTPYSQAQQNGVSGKPLLQAADVIKMVGNAFNGATAMVVQHPTEGQKFIIRGIRCREYPLAPSGKKYATCQWIVDAETKTVCSAPFANQKDLHAHVMDKHVKTATGPVSCGWSGCSKFAPDGIADHRQIAVHLRLHTNNLFPTQSTSRTIRGTKISIENHYTQQDDKGEPRGLALTATLTLRNILCSDSRALTDETSLMQLKHDLIDHLTLNPVVAPKAGEVLAVL